MPKGRRLSQRSLSSERTLEGYLANSAPPRWMERVMQIENGLRRLRAELEAEHRLIRETDPDGFAERWHRIAHMRRYEELNALIRQHNTYYPMERDLPMNPRTGEYITAGGRDFRRTEVTPEWILTQFPLD